MKTRDLVLQLVRANPHVSLKELCEAACIQNPSNIQFHLDKLQAAGLIRWQDMPIMKRRVSEQKKRLLRWQRGDVPLRKMSKAEQDARIEMVTRKAKLHERIGSEVPESNDDAIRGSYGHHQLRHLTARKIG
jgi:SOS-response transcriptional repressor LexA